VSTLLVILAVLGVLPFFGIKAGTLLGWLGKLGTKASRRMNDDAERLIDDEFFRSLYLAHMVRKTSLGALGVLLFFLAGFMFAMIESKLISVNDGEGVQTFLFWWSSVQGIVGIILLGHTLIIGQVFYMAEKKKKDRGYQAT